mgnify:CR=1 FL=1
MVMRMEKPQQSAQLPEAFDSHTAQVEKLNDLHKLLRFLLENDLGLSTHDPAQAYMSQHIQETSASQQLLRFIATIQPHGTQPARTVITYPDVAFVFDTPAVEQAAQAQGNSYQPLHEYRKHDLAELVQDETCGVALSTDHHFAWYMYDALTSPLADVHQRIAADQTNNNWLHGVYHHGPEPLISVGRASRHLGITPHMVEKALRDHRVIKKIGKIIVAPRGKSMRPFITPEQLLSLQEHFHPYNADTHTLLPPQEEEMTCPQLARALGVHDMTVRRAIATLNQEKSEGEDSLTGTTRKEQGRRPTVYYSSEQQARILTKLREKGYSVPAKLRDKLGEDLTHKN